MSRKLAFIVAFALTQIAIWEIQDAFRYRGPSATSLSIIPVANADTDSRDTRALENISRSLETIARNSEKCR